ncbi:IS3 family transposase [Thalassospira mesophila]|uniref:IS3 family transposase n=1 Tax=Thalassospira mesophila TaxID=1293891 RepID=UPI003CCBFC30
MISSQSLHPHRQHRNRHDENIHYYNNDRSKLKIIGLSLVQDRTQSLNYPNL